MNYYSYSTIIVFILFISLVLTQTPLSIIKDKYFLLKNDTSFNIHQRISTQTNKLHSIIASVQNRFPIPNKHNEDNQFSTKPEKSSVLVLTSLSGIYVWWPIIFGGDDSFHLLRTQDDVPRFHDVAGDEHGHIYLTAPHERTVYRLQYSNGWWISNISNHSMINSIRSEMPLFLNIHYISSIVYVYGHTDIQIIDLLQRPRTRGSAPFMQRLRELSPNLHISDLIIDQLTSDGYIVGDSYGWCTVIRCSLNVNECVFLFKIPSSYDNRPYPCTATIDFSNKIMYLSLEEKILGVYLNEQTNFDRREILTEKYGPRSTLGYDDIVVYNNIIFYTDVLRPLLHICTRTNSNSCLNISLIFSLSQRSILPLRLSVIEVSNLRPPKLDESEIHRNESTTILLTSTETSTLRYLVEHTDSAYKETSVNNIWILMLGICIGLLLAGLFLMIYYIRCNKNRPKIKKFSKINQRHELLLNNNYLEKIKRRNLFRNSDLSNSYGNESNMISSSEATMLTTSSSSYRPDTIL